MGLFTLHFIDWFLLYLWLVVSCSYCISRSIPEYLDLNFVYGIRSTTPTNGHQLPADSGSVSAQAMQTYTMKSRLNENTFELYLQFTSLYTKLETSWLVEHIPPNRFWEILGFHNLLQPLFLSTSCFDEHESVSDRITWLADGSITLPSRLWKHSENQIPFGSS